MLRSALTFRLVLLLTSLALVAMILGGEPWGPK